MRCLIANLRFLARLLNISFVAAGLPASLLSQASSNASLNADSLVREVIHNEIQAQLHDPSLWCFREEQQEDGKPSKTLDVCESSDGDVERLLAINGKPLDLAQQRSEDQRIQALLGRPDQIRANQKKQREDAEQERNMLKPFPDAFHFHCQSVSGDLVTLQFEPNAGFRPASRTAFVFHHMEGSMTVDARQKRIVEINGRLTSEVKFAGGLLGHLDKNGTFFVQQEEVAPGHWDLKSLRVHMNGKALFFKTIAVLEKKDISGYRPLTQGTTLQQAVAKLQNDSVLRTASNAGK
jgi:hypothetical protein